MINLKGQRFGRLIVIKDINKRSKHGHIIWLCRCDCGNLTEVLGTNLIQNHTTSCGCFHDEVRRKLVGNSHPSYQHGDSSNKRRIRLYTIWLGMNSRCYYKKAPSYKYYGAKGIQVCPEWRDSYFAFKVWALANGYSGNLTIDRINHKGNYEPSNCQWLTNQENAIKANESRSLIKKLKKEKLVCEAEKK
ncbi:hypothetical protein KA005_28660 [bacterium]|nr:hypothetical protein [bacterium]